MYYSAARLTTYLDVSYSSKVKHDGVEADDIRTPLLERIPQGFLENLDDFRSSLDKEDSFIPFGDQLMAFTHDMGEGEKSFEIFKVRCLSGFIEEETTGMGDEVMFESRESLIK